METQITQLAEGKVLVARMKKGEIIHSETGAFIASKGGEIRMESSIKGGLMTGIMRMAGGESLFMNTLTAEEDVEVIFGGSTVSDILEIKLDGNGFVLGDGAYLAHTGEIEVTGKFGGFSSLLAGSGLVFQKIIGRGSVFVAGEGGITLNKLKAGEAMVVDNSNFLATNEGVQIEKFLAGSNMAGKLFGGEGFLFRIRGPADVYYRSVSLQSMARELAKFFPRS